MSRRTPWSSLSVAGLALAALTGCDTTTQDVQQGVDEVQQEVEQGVDQVEQGVQEGVDQVQEGVDGAQGDSQG